nr:hypothetical protein [Ktedonosporobacter rubrisoli]
MAKDLHSGVEAGGCSLVRDQWQVDRPGRSRVGRERHLDLPVAQRTGSPGQ